MTRLGTNWGPDLNKPGNLAEARTPLRIATCGFSRPHAQTTRLGIWLPAKSPSFLHPPTNSLPSHQFCARSRDGTRLCLLIGSEAPALCWRKVLRGGGEDMPSLSLQKRLFRKELWGLIDDCSTCDLEECPEWCREFVACQMDDLFDKFFESKRQEQGSRA